MATPPNWDNTIPDIHADDGGSQGAVAGKEREGGINVLKEVMKLECASKERIGTSSTRNRPPVKPASGDTTRLPKPQEHCFKHETDPQSSLVKADIPVTTQITDGQEKLFETCKVYKESQLLSLPHNLHSLKIEGCESLVVLPDDLLDGLPILKELQLINCSSLRSIPYPASLTTLYVRKCRNFELLHWLESSKKLSSIQNMLISNSCDSLITLTLDFFPKLKVLSIEDCPNLVSFNVTGVYTGDLALEHLEISDCSGLNSFPDEGFHTPNLSSITLSNCTNLQKFPSFITSLTSLRILFLLRCPHIESFSNGGLPSSLTLLSIGYCDKLTSQREWGLENLESLHYFSIEGGCLGMESFPGEKLLPKNIITLRISKLKSLRKLEDKGFQQLNALRTLKINCCDVLRYLPEQGLPSTLNQLYIKECPLLTPRLEPKTGKYWRKVARIPHIEIDDQRVREHCYRY